MSELYKTIREINQVEKLKVVYDKFTTSCEYLNSVQFVDDNRGKSDKDKHDYFDAIELQLKMLHDFPLIEEKIVGALIPHIGKPKHEKKSDYVSVAKVHLDD
jgi:flagellar biosynthesis/type III secretory pathway M-ring protein FliF/YscJ